MSIDELRLQLAELGVDVNRVPPQPNRYNLYQAQPHTSHTSLQVQYKTYLRTFFSLETDSI